MRNSMEKISIELQFPYEVPDANGIIYTKEAVKNAFANGISNIPIKYMDNDGYETIVGYTSKEPVIPEWDDFNGVLKVKVNGTIYFAGTHCIVNEMSDGIVNDFEITSIGISK